ncbi:MAG: TolC family protein [Ignavibacteria bacterium]|nr:TolC family protein [Ignavibacteria bacterium]
MRKLIIFLLITISVSLARAQTDTDTVRHIGLNGLINSAFGRNVKFEPIEIQKRVELSKKNQVNKQPMPMLEGMIDYIPFDFMAKPEYGAFYSQKLMLGKLGDMEEMSAIKANKQEIEKEMLKIELIKQIKQNYFRLYSLERLLAFNSEYRKIMKNIIKTLENSYASGMGSQSQILKMNNELQMMELEQIEMNEMKKLNINNLRILANVNLPDDYETKDVNSENITELDSNKLVKTMLANNPEFKMINNMLDETRLEKKIAENDRTPDITLRGGIKYMANEPMTFMTFGVSIDLSFMPWNKKRIDAVVEEKSLMELQVSSVQNSTFQYMRNELVSMIIMLNTIKKKADYIREVIIPQTEQTLNSSLVSYSSSAGEFMNLLDSYRKLREADQMLITEETNYLKQYAELEFLTGARIQNINK